MRGQQILELRERSLPFDFAKNLPFPGFEAEAREIEVTDARADQTQSRMPDGCGHAAHLTVFALDQVESDPAVGHVLPKPDGWIARRNEWLWIEQLRLTGERLATLNDDSATQFCKCLGCGNPL